MKLDILVFAAHPDDSELCCSGTIIKHIKMGKKVGVIDLTKGELGTRGTPEIREKEALYSANIQGLAIRNNLGFADGFFANDKQHQLEIVKMIRLFKPEIILANPIEDRHPDHGRAGKLVNDAIFLSGLLKVETEFKGHPQQEWRPKTLFHYIQDRYIKPDFVVDITEEMEQKLETIKAFSSQFYVPALNEGIDEPQTYISTPSFMDSIIARAREVGKPIGAEFGEGFNSGKLIGVNNLFDLT